MQTFDYAQLLLNAYASREFCVNMNILFNF